MKTLYNRKIHVLLLIALSVMLVLSACSGGQGQPQATEPPAAEQPSEESPSQAPADSSSAPAAADRPSYYSEELATVTMYTNSHQSWPYQEDWPIWRWIQEATNITVDVSIPTGNYSETLALNVASGDLQDIIYIPSTGVGRYGADGALLDLSPHLDKMPNVKKYMEENPQLKSRMTFPGGEIYYVLHNGAGLTNYMINFYREDIFEKHNLQPPTTWDELYEVSKELKALYPDSYPFNYRHGLDNLLNFGPAFGTFPGYFPDPETGKGRYGPIEDEFKLIIEYLHKFYKEGLTPPDFLSMDAKAWTQYMVTNQSFITLQYIGQMEIINNQLSEGRLKFLPPPEGIPGNKYIPDTNYEIHGFAISSQVKNLDAALKLLDFFYSEEGTDVLSWGIEGETYTVVDGKRKFHDEFKEFTDLRKNLGIMTPGSYGQFDENALISMIAESERYAYEEAGKYRFPVQVVSPNFTAEEQERFTFVNESISTHFKENMARFIMGDRPLSEWDAYVEEAKSLGVEEMIQLHETAWARSK